MLSKILVSVASFRIYVQRLFLFVPYLYKITLTLFVFPIDACSAPRTSFDTVKECFDIYTDTYGFDEALGMVARNPNLLCVRPRGYGSAEAAGGDAMALSYLIDATRGKGQYPLAILALLLLSKGVGISFF